MKYPNRDELIAKAKDLRNSGLTYKEIADSLGINATSTVQTWLIDEKTRKHRQKKQKLYYEDNKEYLNERSKAYYKEHDNELKEKASIYQAANKDAVRIVKRAYYQNNKEYFRKYNEKYYIDNRDKLIEQSRAYYRNNIDEIKKKERAYNIKNRDRKRAYDRIYRENHREQYTEKCRRRRAIIQSTDYITDSQYAKIWDEQDGRCFYCGVQMLRNVDYYSDDYYNVEHINALSNGGFHEVNNIVYACHKCNILKYTKHVEDWMPSILPKIAANPRLRYDIEEAHMRWLV